MAAVFIMECAAQDPGKVPQKPVAFREAVLRIKELHPAKVHVQENRHLPFPDIHIFGGFGQFKEPGHARQPGQVVVLIRLHKALFMKRVIHGL